MEQNWAEGFNAMQGHGGILPSGLQWRGPTGRYCPMDSRDNTFSTANESYDPIGRRFGFKPGPYGLGKSDQR